MTGKQRAYLRGLANKIDNCYIIGKDGITDNFIKLVDDALNAKELIKIKILESALLSNKEVAAKLCDELCCQSVQMIGSKVVLYRENKKDKKIILPR